MKPKQLQEKIAAAVRKFRESADQLQDGIEKEDEAITRKGYEGMQAAAEELAPLSETQIEAEIREVAVASDEESTRRIREAESRATTAESRVQTLESENSELKRENDGHNRALLVAKVLRESKADEKLRDLYAPDLARLSTEEEMSAYLAREQQREEAIIARVRESAIEGAGPRLPETVDRSGAEWLQREGIPVRPQEAAA